MDSRLEILKTPFFILAAVTYLMVHIARQTNYVLPEIVNSYLTDLICLPVVLVVITAIIRVITHNNLFWPSIEMTLTLALLFTILFELILPNLSPNFTADVGDILSYFLGIFLYFIFIDKKHFITTSSN